VTIQRWGQIIPFTSPSLLKKIWVLIKQKTNLGGWFTARFNYSTSEERTKHLKLLFAWSASASVRSTARTSVHGVTTSRAAPSLPGCANTQELKRTIQRDSVKNAIWWLTTKNERAEIKAFKTNKLQRTRLTRTQFLSSRPTRTTSQASTRHLIPSNN
jgi:hypothetical protein